MIIALDVKESNMYSPVPGSVNTLSETFKICVREHNAHAQLNAGFSLDISHDVHYK
jgi:hypothetical protein